MLSETLNQPYLLLIFVLTGFVGGFIYDLGNFIKFLFSNKKVACVIIDIIQTSLCLFLIFILNVKVNFGEIRLFPFVCFLTSFAIERFTLGKIIAKIYLLCYNLLVKLNKKIWRKQKNAKANKND